MKEPWTGTRFRSARKNNQKIGRNLSNRCSDISAHETTDEHETESRGFDRRAPCRIISWTSTEPWQGAQATPVHISQHGRPPAPHYNAGNRPCRTVAARAHAPSARVAQMRRGRAPRSSEEQQESSDPERGDSRCESRRQWQQRRRWEGTSQGRFPRTTGNFERQRPRTEVQGAGKDRRAAPDRQAPAARELVLKAKEVRRCQGAPVLHLWRRGPPKGQLPYLAVEKLAARRPLATTEQSADLAARARQRRTGESYPRGNEDQK